MDITLHPSAEQANFAVSILRERNCRLLFTVNEWGIDTKGIFHEYCNDNKIIHINWCVDDPFYERVMLRSKFIPSPFRIDFVSDRDYVDAMRTEGYNAHFLPLGVDPQLYHPTGKEYERDCAFVGNSYLAQVDEFSRGHETFLDTMAPFLADCLQQYLRDSSVDIGSVIGEHVKTLSLPSELSFEKATFIAKHFAGYLFRKQVVSALIEGVPGFELYGDDGWQRLFKHIKVNKVRYGNTLRDVYASTRVNVDINRVVIRSGFTQRVFDALAAGAFIITSAKPIVEEFFCTTGKRKEIVTFQNGAELVDLVRYYLSHENERKAIATRGRERVGNHHTYDHRIGEMFQVLSRELG